MNSKIDIINSGLIRIGSRLITSLTDDNKAARLCSVRYEPCKRAVLRMHPWNCAIKRTTLSPLSTTPDFGYEYAFTLPSDCLRVLAINPDEQTDYRIEGRTVLYDGTTIYLKYIYDIADPTGLDVLCAEALGCYIAWDCAYALTESVVIKDEAWKDFIRLISKAKSVDAKEEPTVEVLAEEWLESRESETINSFRGDR